ncbi:MAG: rod shape-determining protein RodA [Patescibacteria group bacterium]|nr:rod shape-determining protein RodA [bacterium]MDZ4240928.1 rod shape-determining protein RodA [Patescibacteria group bacterium]
MKGFFSHLLNIDWFLFSSSFAIAVMGLITMNSFVGESYFFEKQIFWLVLSVCVFYALSFIDFRFLRRTEVVVPVYLSIITILILVLFLGATVKGAQSWFDFGNFSFQPSDPAKLALILILSKYFSRRHVEIAHIRHILVSGFYALVLFLLVFFQPDFGSSIIIFFLWLGMVLVSGISKQHLLIVLLLGLTVFSILWFYVFENYQKQRILTFIHPLTDIQGAGYNAYQSTIAVGSGELWGKGIGYGTQSKLQFLPEYETDFIFAAFAEEWGFIGTLLLFSLYALLFGRIIVNAVHGATNFETLFGFGVAILFMSHFIIHIGMNIGLLPVTGVTVPFMSYGGSHLLTEYASLGILMGMRRYRSTIHKEAMQNELLGVGG